VSEFRAIFIFKAGDLVLRCLPLEQTDRGYSMPGFISLSVDDCVVRFRFGGFRRNGCIYLEMA
jgi:hypothetical protein